MVHLAFLMKRWSKIKLFTGHIGDVKGVASRPQLNKHMSLAMVSFLVAASHLDTDEYEPLTFTPYAGFCFDVERGRPFVEESVGSKPGFRKLGLRKKSHKCAEFEVDMNIFNIKMQCDQDPLRVYADLAMFNSNLWTDTSEMTSGGVFVQQNHRELFLHVAVPQEGWYQLNLYSKNEKETTLKIPLVFTYLFYVRNVTHPLLGGKPKAVADCMRGKFLHRPIYFSANRQFNAVKFKVWVLGATKVIVRTEDGVTLLRKERNGPFSTWFGIVDLENSKVTIDAKVTIEACYGMYDHKFAVLYTYCLNPKIEPPTPEETPEVPVVVEPPPPPPPMKK